MQTFLTYERQSKKFSKKYLFFIRFEKFKTKNVSIENFLMVNVQLKSNSVISINLADKINLLTMIFQ